MRSFLSSAAGGGICLDARGRMVDLAVVRDARRTLRDGGARPFGP